MGQHMMPLPLCGRTLLLLLLLLEPSVHGPDLARDDEWQTPAAELLQLVHALERPCSIRTSSSTLPHDLEQQSEPLLVRPPGREWPVGVKAWRDRSEFLRRHGTVRVEPHSPLATAYTGPRRATTTARGRSLHSVLAAWRHEQQPDSHRQVFEATASTLSAKYEACDSADGKNTSSWIDAMREDLGRLPSFLGSSEAELVLSIGESGTGLPWHSHGAAWLAAVVGSKLWVLHSPEDGSPDFATLPFSAGNWLRRLVESAEQRVEWCIQHPGDVMIVPPFWHHTTLNIGETIAIGGQRNVFRWGTAAQAVEELTPNVDDSNPRLLELTADSMLQLTTEDAGKILSANRGEVMAAALALLDQAIRCEPLNVRLLIKAARLASNPDEKRGLGQPGLGWLYLQKAAATLARLEETSSISGSDSSELGGQVGVAVITLVKDQSEFALPLLTRAVEADRAACNGVEGRDAELLFYLAYAHGRKGRQVEAAVLLEEVIRIDPTHVDANKMLSLLRR